MSIDTDTLTQMIDERLGRRDKLRAQLDALDVEIKVLQEATARIGHGPSLGVRRRYAVTMGIVEDSRERALKVEWAAMLRYIGQRKSMTLDEIVEWAEASGHPFQRNTLRSQVSIYTNKGWLRRVGAGEYALTDEGAVKCDFVPEARNDEADAAATDIGLSSEGEDPFQ